MAMFFVRVYLRALYVELSGEFENPLERNLERDLGRYFRFRCSSLFTLVLDLSYLRFVAALRYCEDDS